MTAFPGPDATYAEVAAWHRAHAREPEPPHEAPPIANGPSLMCNACGVVRINIFAGPFCRGCTEQIEMATGEKL